MRNLGLFIGLVAVAFSCKNTGNQTVIAEVGDAQLTLEQIQRYIPNGLKAEDSVTMAGQYIQQWMTDQIIVKEAEQLSSEDLPDMEMLLQDYKNSLLINEVEKRWINGKLDTNITDNQLHEYYSQHTQEFTLADYVMKVKFFSLDEKSRDLENLKRLFQSDKDPDVFKWQQTCAQKKIPFYYNADEWMTFSTFTQQIPLNIYDKEAFFQGNKNVQFNKDGVWYFIRIMDYKISGAVAPFDLVKPSIREMILNKKKNEIIAQMRSDFYKQETSNGGAIRFDKK
jgi:hypothetical protein